MRIQQMLWTLDHGWKTTAPPIGLADVQLILYFAASNILRSSNAIAELRQFYPSARVVGCSTGGEILGREVYDNTIVATAITLEKSTISVHALHKGDDDSSFNIGQSLAKNIGTPVPRAVFILSDGTKVNGSDLVRGLRDGLPEQVIITGGLAGDGDAFQSTLVGVDSDIAERQVAAISFYGNDLLIGHGSFGGWDSFGPERIVTRSEANVLYELDGQPALDLYRRYLGEDADGLPGSALLFPLRIRARSDSKTDLVRTIVGIDNDARSMTFAGDIPTGYVAQLMRGNFERLIDGAGRAASNAALKSSQPLAILVSCIGRKLLMGQRISEEVEAVAEALPEARGLIGFYSYGEISPHGFTKSCELHNQTMTITTIDES